MKSLLKKMILHGSPGLPVDLTMIILGMILIVILGIVLANSLPWVAWLLGK